MVHLYCAACTPGPKLEDVERRTWQRAVLSRRALHADEIKPRFLAGVVQFLALVVAGWAIGGHAGHQFLITIVAVTPFVLALQVCLDRRSIGGHRSYWNRR